jgi:uncharacterized protein YdaU (DUF1376 family)
MHGTRWLSFEEKGAYMDLLCEQADKGSLDFRKGILSISDIQKILKEKFDPIWKNIKEKFEEKEGYFFNNRLMEELKKRQSYCESRANRSNHTKIIRKSNDDHAGLKNPSQCLNTNTNSNKDTNTIQIRSEKLRLEVNAVKDYPQTLLDEFFSYWTEPNPSKTKMRFEFEKTWDLPRRLATWAKRSAMPRKQYGRQEVSGETLKAQASRLAGALTGGK